MVILLRFSVSLLLWLVSGAALAQAADSEHIKAPHVTVFWIAPDKVGPDLNTIAVGFELEKDWHVYWKNPGDSGAAPKVTFTSTDSQISDLRWPVPKSIPVGDLVNFGYPGPVAGLVFDVAPKQDSKTISITAQLEWLVCRAEECIPGRGTLSLGRGVSRSPLWNSAKQEEIKRLIASIPVLATDQNTSFAFARFEAKNNGVVDLVTQTKSVTFANFELFPVDGAWLQPKFNKVDDGDLVRFRFNTVPGVKAPTSAGVVAAWKDEAGAPVVREWQDLPVVSVAPNTTQTQPEGQLSLAFLILLAVLGGALLNLMPCVFPVLSIKILSLLKEYASYRSRVYEALLYTAGILATFAALGGALLALRAGGEAVGWGFQLQSPWVVFALAILFFVMALNFLGFFDFGNGVMNWAGRHASSGSFASGILAVFVAAPCTGPFMGTALGSTITLSAIESMTLFLSLGFGLALPYLLLSLVPKALSILPRPGPWMVRLKEFMAFPLLVTVVWLLWVLAMQVGPNAWIYSLGVLLGIAFAFWIAQTGRSALTSTRRLTALLVAFAALALGVLGLNRLEPSQVQAAEGWERLDASTEQKLVQARRDGRSVFIDYTAAWCITCQWNKRAVLDTQAAVELFRKRNTWLVRADWTTQDPVVTASLAGFGRNSVPLYVFYPPKGEPKILPQLLTYAILEQMYLDE